MDSSDDIVVDNIENLKCEYSSEGEEEEEAINEPSQSQPSLKHRRMFSVDAPAKVKNLDRFLKCCGGLKNIDSIFKVPRDRLQFKFRPDDPNSIPMFSERVSTSDIAVKMKRLKKRDGTCEYKFEPYGVIDTTFHFENKLCDMQLLPNSSDIRNEILKSDFILNCNQNSLSADDNSNTLMKNFFFSRFITQKPRFLQINEEENAVSDLICQFRKSRKLFGSFIKWDEDVPDSIPENVRKQIDKQMFDPELGEKITNLFKERPIWSRHALLSVLKCNFSKLKYTLPLFAFFYISGPFRCLWIRFGYNPINNMQSKIYQSIDLRFRLPNTQAALSNQYQVSLFKDRPTTPKIELINSMMFADGDRENRDEPDENYIFRRGQISIFKRSIFQLCDIELDEVQQIVHENDGNESECNEKEGWCTKGAMERIRKLMYAVLNESLKDPNINQTLEKQEIDFDLEISEVYDHFMFEDGQEEQENIVLQSEGPS